MPRLNFLAPALLALPLLSLAAPAPAERAADSLSPIVACLSGDAFRVYEAKRLPAKVSSRPLLSPGGQFELQLADGYGLKLYTPRGKLFAEVSIERAPPQAFAANREAIRTQLQGFADHHPQGAVPLERTELRGVQMLAVRQTSLVVPGPMAYLALLYEPSALMVNAQWLKPSPPARAFTDLDGYEKLRKVPEELLVDCMLAHKP